MIMMIHVYFTYMIEIETFSIDYSSAVMMMIGVWTMVTYYVERKNETDRMNQKEENEWKVIFLLICFKACIQQ